MEIYFSFQAALCFSIAHIFIRRGLVRIERDDRIVYFACP